MAAVLGIDWHEGEIAIQKKTGVPQFPNPTQPSLYPRGAVLVSEAPLLAAGTLDSQGRPWTSLWGGEPGFAQPLGQNLIGMTAMVVPGHDPVISALGDFLDGGDTKPGGDGKMMSGLTMDLDRRNRVKIAGKVMAGAVAIDGEADGVGIATGSLKLVTRVDQSLANCPKYINRKVIKPTLMAPKLAFDGTDLPTAALELIGKADAMFVSSSHFNEDMDTNHRGGAPGFLRVAKDDATGANTLVWPEYSGNRLYQTLGNLEATPRAGLVIPDFETGNVLYVTGDTKTLVGKEASELLPRSNLAVELTITRAILVESGLPFRGAPVEASPYNPRIWPLASEADSALGGDKSSSNTATLVEKTPITSTITRYRFRMAKPSQYTVGQWAALDFSDELDIGYSHMRNDDPTSLNDDFVRTFTISSAPPPKGDVPPDCFEMTIKNVGRVTDFMSKLQVRSSPDIPLRGIGGDFSIDMPEGAAAVPFIAGGIGITPLLAFLPYLDMKRVRLFWSMPCEDVNLAFDTLENNPALAPSVEVFLTGRQSDEVKAEAASKLQGMGAVCHVRRITKEDLKIHEFGEAWYLCTGTALRNTLLAWLEGKDVHYENFNF